MSSHFIAKHNFDRLKINNPLKWFKNEEKIRDAEYMFVDITSRFIYIFRVKNSLKERDRGV